MAEHNHRFIGYEEKICDSDGRPLEYLVEPRCSCGAVLPVESYTPGGKRNC